MGNFSDVPSNVMLEIFARLPAESIGDCKSVSKTWNKFLRRPSFIQRHSDLLLINRDSSADSSKFSLIFTMDDFSRNLYFLEYDDKVSSHRLRKLKLTPDLKMYRPIGSCNGLVCIIGLPNHYTIDRSTGASYVAYICNPITGESVTLPELDRSICLDLYPWILSGFGYVASTNEYKVVRLYSFTNEPKLAHIEVYTLGSGLGWRNIGKVNKDCRSPHAQDAVFADADGVLIWNFGNGNIMEFDLANEAFVELDEYYNQNFPGGVLGGHYCRTHYKDRRSSDVWLLKKNEDKRFSWSKEFSLINPDRYTLPHYPIYIIPFALMSSGRVLLCYEKTKLYLYDLKSASSKMLEDFGRNVRYPVPHMNTLVPLKAFGEENMETGRSVEVIET